MSNVTDVFIIQDSNISGTELIQEVGNSVGDYFFESTNKIRLNVQSSKLLNMYNFYVVVTYNTTQGDKYLFEEDTQTGQNIINTQIGDEFATVISKVYAIQEDYNYKKIVINQIDLSPYYGLRLDYFKFQYDDQTLQDNIDNFIWYNTLSIENIQKNEMSSFWIQVKIPKIKISQINKNIQIHYTAYEY